ADAASRSVLSFLCFGGISSLLSRQRRGYPSPRGCLSLSRICFRACPPGDHLVRHGVNRLVVLLMGLAGREVLEISEQRQQALRAHCGDFEFAHDQPQILDGPNAAGTSIADKTGSFVIPFVE